MAAVRGVRRAPGCVRAPLGVKRKTNHGGDISESRADRDQQRNHWIVYGNQSFE
jgi:hypothetical protein